MSNQITVTVETTHFFETSPHVDSPVYIAVKLNVTPYEPAIINAPVERCRPAEGGTVEVLGTEVIFDSSMGKIDKIPEDWLLDMAMAIGDIWAGQDDDELYRLAELEIAREYEYRYED